MGCSASRYDSTANLGCDPTSCLLPQANYPSVHLRYRLLHLSHQSSGVRNCCRHLRMNRLVRPEDCCLSCWFSFRRRGIGSWPTCPNLLPGCDPHLGPQLPSFQPLLSQACRMDDRRLGVLLEALVQLAQGVLAFPTDSPRSRVARSNISCCSRPIVGSSLRAAGEERKRGLLDLVLLVPPSLLASSDSLSLIERKCKITKEGRENRK